MVPNLMTDYKIIDEIVNGRPVYKSANCSDCGFDYLFMDSGGHWIVRRGDFKYEEEFCLGQWSKYSLGPDPDLPWDYSFGNHSSDEEKWRDDDATLKCHGWQV